MTSSKTRDIKVENIHDAPGENPNVVDDMTMAMLTEAIRKYGFLQPILVLSCSRWG